MKLREKLQQEEIVQSLLAPSPSSSLGFWDVYKAVLRHIGNLHDDAAITDALESLETYVDRYSEDNKSARKLRVLADVVAFLQQQLNRDAGFIEEAEAQFAAEVEEALSISAAKRLKMDAGGSSNWRKLGEAFAKTRNPENRDQELEFVEKWLRLAPITFWNNTPLMYGMQGIKRGLTSISEAKQVYA